MDVQPWYYDSPDSRREETKRKRSPTSFFFSQGRALVLAASYFTPDRLEGGYSGTAKKHLHRIHLALFGQLLASLEYLFKDFIAQVVDLIPLYDEKVHKATWIDITPDHILSGRSGQSTPGALLLHPTVGWHEPDRVNARYQELFAYQPIASHEIPQLRQLWLLRHSVAHNAGFVTAYDASRASLSGLSETVADIRPFHLADSFRFLDTIAARMAQGLGDKILVSWLQTRSTLGFDYKRDQEAYKSLKLLATHLRSRAKDLPTIRKSNYSSDFRRANSDA